MTARNTPIIVKDSLSNIQSLTTTSAIYIYQNFLQYLWLQNACSILATENDISNMCARINGFLNEPNILLVNRKTGTTPRSAVTYLNQSYNASFIQENFPLKSEILTQIFSFAAKTTLTARVLISVHIASENG